MISLQIMTHDALQCAADHSEEAVLPDALRVADIHRVAAHCALGHLQHQDEGHCGYQYCCHCCLFCHHAVPSMVNDLTRLTHTVSFPNSGWLNGVLV